MLSTISYLVSNNMTQELDNLMGHNLPWQQAETKDGIKYYKLVE